jgi:hypothetical protein
MELNVETIVEQCPLCGTELSKVKFQEIQAKLRAEERERSAEDRRRLAEAEKAMRQRVEQHYKEEAEKQKQAAVKQAMQEAHQKVVKITAERDQAINKVKEAAAREAEIRKQAEQEAEKKKQVEVVKIAAERDQAIKKLKEAEVREAEIRKQVEQEAANQKQAELAQQRHALEKAHGLALIKQQSGFNRERESFQKKMKVMEHQLQKKTANELGDGAEIDVFEALRESFSGDRITRIPKGQAGADILHEVLHKGQTCGRIIIDAKNRQNWQNGYVTKLRQDQVEAGAEHAILASATFPAGKKEMCIESDVIVINPARVVYITAILRQAMVTMHVLGLSMKERAGKMSRLYKLITSESYSRKFDEAGKLTKEILELDVEEKKSHDRVWRTRGALATRINNVLREIDTDVAAVIEGEDEEEAPSAFTVKRADGASRLTVLEEASGWKKQ